MRYGLMMLCCALVAFPNESAIAQPVCAMSFINPNARVGRSPHNTGVPPLFRYTYSVTLLDAFGAPVVGWPGADVAIAVGPPCAPALIPAAGVSDAAGVLTWTAAALDVPGGSCPGAASAVFILSLACALPTPIPFLTSPDEDGNGMIALADLDTFRGAFVNNGPIWVGDLNFSGSIDLGDLAFFQAHFLGF